MNNASISKIFDVLKSWVFSLSLRNNVSALFCVCALLNLTYLKSLLNLLNKYGFFNTNSHVEHERVVINIDLDVYEICNIWKSTRGTFF